MNHEVVLPSILEAILFAAAKPLSIDTLAEILDSDEETVIVSLDYYEAELVAQQRGLRLKRSGAGIELVSAPEYSEYIAKIRERKDELSKAALETLAVIAFKQPVTKAEIEELRGVNSDKIIKQLLDKELVAELGRKESIGRPVLYGTTEAFLRSLGIASLNDLKEELTVNLDTLNKGE